MGDLGRLSPALDERVELLRADVGRPVPCACEGQPRVSAELAERLSVILLTHNCAHRIDVVIQHLLQLGVPVVAVDNASVDGTPERLVDAGVQTIRLDRNIGAAARNAGVRAVATPYVAFCDDDGWYERSGLDRVCDLFDDHPALAVANARILVGDRFVDPISTEMAASPLADSSGIPGSVLIGFMAGACIFRVSAFWDVAGYDERFFMGAEEETVSYALLMRGWQLRYVPAVTVHHRASLANVRRMRRFGLRNTLWNAWLRRPWRSALRWTLFVLADAPKNISWVQGVGLAMAGIPWVLRNRTPMSTELDEQLRILDARRFATRRPLWSRRQPDAEDPSRWESVD
jgi:GT2 family glycosyltransferase